MITVDTIPAELRALPHWVCFNERKEPINPHTGSLGDSTDPSTWGDFETALRAAERFRLKGVGFVFTLESKIVGIDIDECRDPETEAIVPAAQEIIDGLNSYTEISPSRRGVHILCRGVRPIAEGKIRSMSEFCFKKIEMYSQERYFTVTGNHLEGTPTTIETRSAELAAVHSKIFEPETKTHQNGFHKNGNASVLSLSDIDLITKAKSASNGAKFSRLWCGDTSDYGGDDSSADLALCNHLAFWTDRDAGRIDSLFRQSGLFRAKWDRADYRERTIGAAISGTLETYGSKKNDSGLEEGTESPGVKIEHLTDVGNAKRLIQQHGKNLRYAYQWNTWLIWDGRRWKKDDTGEIVRLAKDTVAGIYAEAAKQDEESRKKVAAHAMRSEATGRIEAMISLARSEAEVAVTPKIFDTDPMLLNVENGVVDLRTGELRPHRREDSITKLTLIRYDPEATCERWEEFLSEILRGKDDLVNFLWHAIGYSLTGLTSEQCFFLCWGTGSNGKSTLLELLSDMIGEYGKTAEANTFNLKKDEIRNDLARLAGARFVSAKETEQGRRLAESIVKTLTGSDTMTA